MNPPNVDGMLMDAPHVRRCWHMVSKISPFRNRYGLAQIRIGSVYDIGIATGSSKPIHLGLALGHIADRSLLTRALLKYNVRSIDLFE
jgi:hypothetical protein